MDRLKALVAVAAAVALAAPGVSAGAAPMLQLYTLTNSGGAMLTVTGPHFGLGSRGSLTSREASVALECALITFFFHLLVIFISIFCLWCWSVSWFFYFFFKSLFLFSICGFGEWVNYLFSFIYYLYFYFLSVVLECPFTTFSFFIHYLYSIF